MSFQYALKCDKIKGKNPNIKDAISITMADEEEFVPLIIDCPANHAGTNSGSFEAVGCFRPQFYVNDPGELEAALGLQAVAANVAARTGEKYTLTRYTVQDNEVVKDTEMVFNAHYCLIDRIDGTSGKCHLFALGACQGRAKVNHMSFKAGTGATKLKTDQNVATILMVDQNGHAVIQPA